MRQGTGEADVIPLFKLENADTDARANMCSVIAAQEKILKKRRLMDAQGHASKPLYVLVGEDHESSQHYLHHMLLLESLKPFERHLIIAYEQPYDLLARFYMGDHRYINRPDILAELVEQDQRTALSLKLRFYAAENPNAYYAHKTLADYVIRRVEEGKGNVSFVSSDISYDADEVVECADPMAQYAIKACNENPKNLFHIASSAGMRLRNQHMVTMLSQVAARQGAGIVVQFCGKAHINGDFDENAPKDGLAQQFKRQGDDIVVLSLYADDFVMPHSGLSVDQLIECQTPSGPTAEYDPRFSLTTKVDEGRESQKLRSKSEEAAYLEKQLNQFGMRDYAVELAQYEALKRQYRKEVDICFTALRQRPAEQIQKGYELKLKA